MLLLFSSLTMANGLMGLDYTPFGRGDLAWTQTTASSELAFAENEGLIQPNLQPWIGFHAKNKPHSHQFEVNVLSHRISTFYAEDQNMTQRYQVLRPGYAFRRHFPQTESPVNPYARISVHHNFARITNTSTAYTKAEAKDMDLASKELATQLRGSGSSIGGGIRYAIKPSLYIGARWDLNVHVTNYVSEEGAVALDVFADSGGFFCVEWQGKNRQ